MREPNLKIYPFSQSQQALKIIQYKIFIFAKFRKNNTDKENIKFILKITSLLVKYSIINNK
ncbi:MAG: hypothetical protein D8H92_07495 [Campylobacter sp.]|nr:MAG: hypothetical protein D8H92_07495 [Campylobacter sp.]